MNVLATPKVRPTLISKLSSNLSTNQHLPTDTAGSTQVQPTGPWPWPYSISRGVPNKWKTKSINCPKMLYLTFSKDGKFLQHVHGQFTNYALCHPSAPSSSQLGLVCFCWVRWRGYGRWRRSGPRSVWDLGRFQDRVMLGIDCFFSLPALHTWVTATVCRFLWLSVQELCLKGFLFNGFKVHDQKNCLPCPYNHPGPSSFPWSAA